MNKPARLLALLGGPRKVGAILGIHESGVSRWPDRGNVPAHHNVKLMEYAMDIQGKERVTTLYDSTFVQKGRLTCRSPNLQQLPPQVRACLTVPPGYKLVSADFSQIELRVAACLDHDEAMIKAFNYGTDIQSQVS